MPHGHLFYLPAISQDLVKSQELEIPWGSLSGMAFAFQLGELRCSEEESRWQSTFEMFVTGWCIRIRRRSMAGRER